MSFHRQSRNNRRGWTASPLGHRLLCALLTSLQILVPTLAAALPSGGQVAGGQATISQPTSKSLQIQQSTEKAIINWQQFSIAGNEAVRFSQPSVRSIALNRVIGVDPSVILGQLQSNGRIFLINPNGILFGAGAQINVGGLLATTLQIRDEDFMAGRYLFAQDPLKSLGTVINRGDIRVSDHGFVILTAPGVANEGLIVANLGKAVLASGQKLTVDLMGDGLINYAVSEKVLAQVTGPDGKPLSSAVSNTGTIQADGGQVILSAKASGDIFSSVVNQGGVIRAQSLVDHGGVVRLEGSDPVANTGTVGWQANLGKVQNAEGKVLNSGTIDVSAREVGAAQGQVTITGEMVGVAGTILARGAEGAQGGRVLISSTDKTVATSESLIDTSGVGNSTAGNVVIWSDKNTMFGGTILAQGGALGGNGGQIEVSGHENLGFFGQVNALAPIGATGSLLLDPANITVATGGAATLVQVDQFGDTPAASLTIDPATINAAAANVTLQANNDITVTNAIAIPTNGLGITMQAGRDILVNNSIGTTNGNISMTANDSTSIVANRANGANGDIIFGAGANLGAGTGNITLTIDPATAGNFAPGSITTVRNLTTTTGNIVFNSPNTVSLSGTVNAGSGTVTINTNTNGGGQSFTMNAGSSITTTNATAGAVAINVNTAGGGTGIAALRDITTGNGGTLTVATNTGGNATGGDITQTAGTLLNVGTGTINLSTSTAAGSNIGTAGTPILTTAGTISATGGGAGIFIQETNGATISSATTAANGNIQITTTTGDLTVGGNVTAGGTGNVTLTASAGDLLRTAGTVAGNLVTLTAGGANGDIGTVAQPIQTTATNLAFTGAGTGNVFITESNGATLNASSTGTGNITVTNTIGNLTVGGNVTTGGTGTLALTNSAANAVLTINGAVTVTGPGGVTYTSDNMTLTGATNAGVNIATLQPNTAGQLVNLGGADAVGTLGLTDAELDTVTAGTLRAGRATSGNMTISAALTPAGTTTLSLISGGTVSQNAGATITETNLRVSSANAVSLTQANDVTTFAGSITNAGQALQFTDANGFTVGTVDTVTGITTNNANAALIATTGNILINDDIAAGTGNVGIQATTGTISQNAGDTITAAGLTTISQGTTTLTEANDVTTLAGNITGAGNAFQFTDSNGLTIGTMPAVGGVAATNGLSTTNGAISVTTTNGALTVSNTAAALDVNAGTSTVALTAGGVNQLLTVTGAVTGTGGVTYTADNMTLTGATNAGANIATLQPNTAGQLVNLGAADAAGTLGLTDAELDTVTAGTLRVGRANSGNMTISAAIDTANTTTTSLISGGTVTQTAPITETNLAVTSVGAVTLTNAANDVTTLAATVSGAGNGFSYTDANALTVGTVDSITGLSTTNGAISVTTTNGALTVSNTAAALDVNAGTSTVALTAGGVNQLLTVTGAVTGTGGVTYTADNMTLTGATNAGANIATLQPNTAGQLVNLGAADAAGTLGLTDAELDTVTAGTLRVGRANSGNMTISAAIDTANTTTTSLISGGTVTQTAPITETNLAVTSVGAVTLTNAANDVTTLAATVSGAGNGLSFQDTNALTIGAVDGATGLTTNNGDIALQTGGALAINQIVNAGTANLGINAAGAVTQTAPIVAGGLSLQGTGPYTLTNASNDVDTVAATTGALQFTDVDGLTVGTVPAVGPLGAVSGLTAAGNVVVTTTNGGALTLDQPITTTSTGTVTLTNAGTVALNADIAADGAVTQNGAGAVTTTGTRSLTTTDDAVTLTQAVTLGGDLTISSGTGPITFNSTINGGANLTANSTGTTTFGGAVGTGTPLTTLTTNAGGTTALTGGPVTTTGAQTYNDAVTLGANTTLTSTGSGNITLGSTVDGAQSLAVNTAGTTTFAGAVGNTTAVTSLTTNAAGTTALTGGTVTTTGAQTYNDAVTLGANTTLTSTGSGNITLGSTVDGTQSLAVNTAGTTTFGGIVGGTTALTSLTTDAGGTTDLNGGTVTTTGAQTYNDAVLLSADTTLTTGAGNLTFGSTLNSTAGNTFALTANSIGTTTFGGAVGGTDALSTLTTNAGGTTALNGGPVTTTGAQTYNDAVTLGAATTLTSTASGAITLNSTVNGAQSLIVNTAGATTFAGTVGGTTPLTSVTTDQPGTVTVASATTTGAQIYNENTVTLNGTYTTTNSPFTAGTAAAAITLGGDTTVATGTGNQTVNGTVNGAQSLTANSTGLTTFNGAVGNSTPLTTLTTNAGGTTAVNGGSVTTTGTQTYGDAVTMNQATTLTSTGGTVQFDTTVTNTAAGASLTVDAPTITLNAATTVTTTNGTLSFFTDTLNTNGASINAGTGAFAIAPNTVTKTIEFGDTDTARATDVYYGSNFGSIVAGSFTVGRLTHTGNIFVTGVANLTTPLTVINGGTGGLTVENAALTSPTNSNVGLVSGSGGTTLAADVTVGTGTLRITTPGALTQTAGALTADTLALAAGTGINVAQAGNNVTTLAAQTPAGGIAFRDSDGFVVGSIGASVDGFHPAITGLTAGAGNVALSAAGAVTQTAPIVAGGLSLQGTGPYTLTNASNDVDTVAATTGALQFTDVDGLTVGTVPAVGPLGAVSGLTAAGNVVVTTTNGGALTLDQPITTTSTGTVTLTNAGTVALNADIAADGAVTQNGAGAVTTTGTRSLTTTDDAVTLTQAVTLGGDLTISSGTGPITFNSTINGGANLTANSTGTTTFGGAVGTGTPLTTLTTNAGGTTALTGGPVTTTGAQTYNDAVTLGANTTLTSTGSGNITLGSTVDGAQSLAVNTAGTTTFAGAVGNTTAVTSLTTNAAGTTALTGGTVTTTGAQTYNDAVTLGANTTLTSTGSGNITLGSTVDGTQSLAVNTAGTTTFGGIVGGTTALTSLTTDAGGTTDLNGGTVTTTGAQTYNDAVLLSADTTLTTGAGNLTFGSTLNSTAGNTFALTANSIGTTTFGGAVGGTDALSTLTTNAGGTTALNGGPVTTTGAQTYNDAVTLGAATTLTSTASGAITLNSTVNGAQSLIVNTAGATTFAGTVGGTTPLTSVTTDQPGTVTVASATTTGAQIYNENTVTLNGTYTTTNSPFTAGTAAAAITLGGDTTVATGTGNQTVNGTVNGAQSLTANSTGLTTFNGAVGNSTPLTTLTTNAGGTTAVNGGSVTTTGTQTYGDAVTMNQATTLTSTGGTVQFDTTVTNTAAGASLTVDAPTITLNAATTVTTTNGTLSFFTDTLNTNGASINAGTGAFAIAPNTVTKTIEFGDTDTARATDVYYGSNFGSIVAGSFTVGRLTHTGNIFVTGVANLTTPLTVINGGTGGLTVENAALTSPTNSNVGLVSGSGGTTLAADVTVGTGTLRITTPGALTQTAGALTADTLALAAGTGINVAQAGNNVTTLAAQTPAGGIAFRDSDGFVVGSIGASVDGFHPAITGLTAGAGNVALSAAGAVTQTAPIVAGGLSLQGTGPYTLTNASNDVDTVAATTGALQFTDVDGLTVGTVPAVGPLGAVSGLTAAGQSVTLTTGDTLTQTQPIVADSLTATTLNNAGAAITLTNPNNAVTTITLQARNATDTADAAGAIAYRDADGVDVAGGRTASTFDLTTNGPMTESGTLVVAGITTLAAGGGNDITLNNAANNFSTVNVTSGNNVTLQDSNALGLGTLTLSGTLNVTAAGAITDANGPANNITAATANLTGASIGTAGDPIETSVGTLNATTTAGGIFVTEANAVTLGNVVAGAGDMTITNTTGDMTINTVTATAGGVNLTTAGGSILDGNAVANNVTASVNSTLNALGGVIGVAADPIEVNVNGATLGVAATNQIANISATLNGTVLPSNTLIILNNPPGLVLFNGVPINPPPPPLPPLNLGIITGTAVYLNPDAIVPAYYLKPSSAALITNVTSTYLPGTIVIPFEVSLEVDSRSVARTVLPCTPASGCLPGK